MIMLIKPRFDTKMKRIQGSNTSIESTTQSTKETSCEVKKYREKKKGIAGKNDFQTLAKGFELRNKTCFLCLRSLVKTEGKEIRSVKTRDAVRSRIFTCTGILTKLLFNFYFKELKMRLYITSDSCFF